MTSKEENSKTFFPITSEKSASGRFASFFFIDAESRVAVLKDKTYLELDHKKHGRQKLGFYLA